MSAISMPAPVATPAVTPAGAPQAGEAGAEPGEFASLMAGLLGEDAVATPGETAAPVPADQAAEQAAGTAAEPAVDPALALLASGAQVAPTAPGTVDPKVPGTPAPTAPVVPGPMVVRGRPGPESDGEIVRTYGCTTGVLTKGQHPVLPGQALPGQPVAGQPVAGQALPGQAPALPGAAPATGVVPGEPSAAAVPATTAPTAPAEAVPTTPLPATGETGTTDLTGLPATARPADQAPAAAVQPGVPTTPVSAPAPAAPLAAPAAAAPVHAGPQHVPDQVTAQVFPEIGKLAVRASSAGEGVHRITLNLHPETLGDVRVTLVVRGGEMKVSIHAATEAGRIMADSLPELRRLLATAGAGDASLAVRDSSAGGTTMSSADQGSDRSDLGRSGYGAPGRDTHDQGARTRDGHHATDGTNRGPRGVIPGPHDPARATRTAGVDVTV